MTAAYFPIQKRWRSLRPLFERPDVIHLMHEEMECYSQSSAEDNGYQYRPRPFDLNLRPEDWDSCDWRFNRGRPGPRPAFWSWACHSACHWVTSHNLMVISQLEPDRPWQISTSDKHSTVVDLDRELMFDTNWAAMSIAPDVCWREAVDHHTAELLPLGIYMNHAGVAA